MWQRAAHSDSAGVKVGKQRSGDLEHCLGGCHEWGHCGAQGSVVRKLGTLSFVYILRTLLYGAFLPPMTNCLGADMSLKLANQNTSLIFFFFFFND